jgi:2-dehydro-3-deoxy-D-arabinonate dehydratase
VPRAIFRVRLAGGQERLAVGSVDEGPRKLLHPDVTIDVLLASEGPALDDALTMPTSGDVPGSARVLAPVGSQEIWAAGVTYRRSRDARVEEAIEPSPYDRVYDAERPELFLKSAGWRARGPDAPVGIRADSTWDVPEPEVTLVLDADVRIVGYTLGNDMSSRSIEGENTLYLSQAKIYEGSCAIGPAIVPATDVEPPFPLAIRIERDRAVVYDAATSTAEMARSFDELAAYLGRALRFPVGALLMTGTGLVPEAGFTLEEGDVVTITADGLGSLSNRVERVGTPARG